MSLAARRSQPQVRVGPENFPRHGGSNKHQSKPEDAAMTTIKSSIAAAALAAMLSFGAHAGEAGVTPEQIAAAQTPAQHEAIAATYDQEASRLEAKAREHQQMADAYRSAPAKKGMDTAAMRAHCTKLSKQYSEAAAETRAMAKEHRAMQPAQ